MTKKTPHQLEDEKAFESTQLTINVSANELSELMRKQEFFLNVVGDISVIRMVSTKYRVVLALDQKQAISILALVQRIREQADALDQPGA